MQTSPNTAVVLKVALVSLFLPHTHQHFMTHLSTVPFELSPS